VTETPEQQARTQLKLLRRRIEAAERQLELLHTQRATMIFRFNERRVLSNAEMARILDLTTQRVGQIATEQRTHVQDLAPGADLL
jgi:hypothetical protein